MKEVITILMSALRPRTDILMKGTLENGQVDWWESDY